MRDPPTPTGVDVYLFPAALGGGRGDIDEVYTAGGVLGDRGARVRILRLGSRPIPSAVVRPGEWPAVPRLARIGRHRPWAFTVSAAWGVTAAPKRPGPLGGAGPWALESAAVEETYGADRTVHISIEEFARTLTSREQTIERYREGGWSTTAIRNLASTVRFRTEVAEFRRAFRRFRGFDRANVLSVFPGFEPRPGFAHEFPEAVQCGPLWPCRFRPRRKFAPGSWVWYASPSTAPRLAPALLAGIAHSGRRIHLGIRGPSPGLGGVDPAGRWTVLPSMGTERWARMFESAELRIVTGSRSLLEALEVGGPFLYFNGVLGSGASARRHRPEKLQQLLRGLKRDVPGSPVLRDLRSFGRGQRVAQVAERAASPEWRRGFPRGVSVRGYRPPFDSANALLADLLGQLRRERAPPNTAAQLVSEYRSRSNIDRAVSPGSLRFKRRRPLPKP
jgi:hypothetical protein